MIVKVFNEADLYWSVAVQLNNTEWPELDNGGDWLDRPIRRWIVDSFGYIDCFFAASGLIYFKNHSDAEWFRMVWEQGN